MVKYFKASAISSILCVLFNACNISDNVENISGGYQFCHEGKDNNFIIGKNEIWSNIIAFNYDDNFILVKQQTTREIVRFSLASNLSSRYRIYYNFLIDPNISEKRDDYEVLIHKEKFDTTLLNLFCKKGITINNTLEDIQKSQEIIDSIIKNDQYYIKMLSNKFNYWIISHKNDSLIGPLNKNEYIQKRNELNVPELLKLNE